MADPVLNPDVLATTLKRLLWQFRGQPNIEAILSSYLVQCQELENMFIDLLILRRLENAEGAQLDGIGSIVGELRLGQNDTDYRAAIFGRVRRNRGNARVEDIILLFVLLLGPAFPIEVVQSASLSGAAFFVFINAALGGVGVPSPSVLNSQLQQTKGGGIRANLIFNIFDVGDTFTYASGDVPEADLGKGYSDDGQTLGGYYADIADSSSTL